MTSAVRVLVQLAAAVLAAAFAGCTPRSTSPAPEPPFLLVPPASACVEPGHAARFRVEAAGAEPLSYRWTREGTLIAGATGPSHVTLPVTEDDAGDRFRVIVTNPGGSVVSAPVRLRVGACEVPEHVAAAR